MGNVVGSQTETNAGDDGNQKITEARKRYLQEQFEEDDEAAKSDADSGREPDFDRNRSRKPSVLNEIEMKVMSINPKDHSYPFENLVFEGGGSKGHAYAGAIKALEEVGLIKQIKRYAGASAGAMTASLLAVGYDSKDLQDFLTQDLSSLLLDSTYGKLSYLPNLMSGYGCNPANKFYDWFGELLEKKMDEKDVTFEEYADAETDLFRYICEQRIGVELDPTPNTKLGREKMKLQRDQEIAKREHRRVVLAVEEFMKEEFSTKSSELLFGKDCTVEDAFELLDRNKNGEINFQELINFIQGTGVSLQQRFLGYQRKEIDGLFNYALTLENAIMTNVQRAFVNRQDVDRTVGINTGHVGTSDFTLEDGDRSFAVAQGYKSTMIFLKYFVAKKLLKDAESLPELASYMSSSLRNDAREEYENGVPTGMMSWTP
uniref:EF-hand domain-containing protein n=1 Tax=Magallana gigas TaxID=29159 RepID=K1QW66_MAGGI